ncbi:MAG TPA: hypothetical protein EYP59_03000 [Thiotrichaceae bacterium]|nr:hypothetical protein [Thiotrichaceae bacterium]
MEQLIEPELDEKVQEYKGQKMSSVNHSFVQTRIAGLLFNDERFTPFVELSCQSNRFKSIWTKNQGRTDTRRMPLRRQTSV